MKIEPGRPSEHCQRCKHMFIVLTLVIDPSHISAYQVRLCARCLTEMRVNEACRMIERAAGL